MQLPPSAQQRIDSESVVWLTTITDSGAPAPNPIWFILDGQDLVVFSSAVSRRVHNIRIRPKVAMHFNSDPGGNEIVIINGEASLPAGRKPSEVPAFVAKYRPSIEGPLGMTLAEFDTVYDTEIRIHPNRVRLTP